MTMGKVQYRRSKDAIHSEVGEDVIALHIPRGHCYGMANVSAEVWRMLDEPIDLDAICSRLIELYDVDPELCRSDIAALLEQFRNEGLVEAVKP